MHQRLERKVQFQKPQHQCICNIFPTPNINTNHLFSNNTNPYVTSQTKLDQSTTLHHSHSSRKKVSISQFKKSHTNNKNIYPRKQIVTSTDRRIPSNQFSYPTRIISTQPLIMLNQQYYPKYLTVSQQLNPAVIYHTQQISTEKSTMFQTSHPRTRIENKQLYPPKDQKHISNSQKKYEQGLTFINYQAKDLLQKAQTPREKYCKTEEILSNQNKVSQNSTEESLINEQITKQAQNVELQNYLQLLEKMVGLKDSRKNKIPGSVFVLSQQQPSFILARYPAKQEMGEQKMVIFPKKKQSLCVGKNSMGKNSKDKHINRQTRYSSNSNGYQFLSK